MAGKDCKGQSPTANINMNRLDLKFFIAWAESHAMKNSPVTEVITEAQKYLPNAHQDQAKKAYISAWEDVKNSSLEKDCLAYFQGDAVLCMTAYLEPDFRL